MPDSALPITDQGFSEWEHTPAASYAKLMPPARLKLRREYQIAEMFVRISHCYHTCIRIVKKSRKDQHKSR